MTIKVTVGNNINRDIVHIDADTTLRACLEAQGVDYSRGAMTLDGCNLKPGDLDKTFAEMSYDGTPGHTACYLLSMVKTDNAA